MKIGRIVVVGLAVVGVGLGVYMAIRGGEEPEPAKPLEYPMPVPYSKYVSGTGVIEASEDAWIATHLSGVITDLYVKESDQVVVGEPLFRIDDRQLRSEFKLAEADLEVAKKRVREAANEVDDKSTKLEAVNRLADKRAISVEEVDSRRHAVRLARAKLATAEAEVVRREAQAEVIATQLERSLVRSPIVGQVLQVNTALGEYAVAGEMSVPLMIIGLTSPLWVRANIDERDAWRVTPDALAIAVPRGQPGLQIPLQFVEIYPYLVPKRSLTGDTSERVDTRVLEVIYSFDPEGYPVYVGQQVDLFVSEVEQEVE